VPLPLCTVVSITDYYCSWCCAYLLVAAAAAAAAYSDEALEGRVGASGGAQALYTVMVEVSQ
jgi:hypothetical protein